MNEQLSGKRVAILVADGFEQVELTQPKQALELAGATTQIVSPAKGQVKGWNHTEWGDQFPVDLPLEQARPDDFDALLLPGGVMNPDKLRMNAQAVQFVKSFFEAGAVRGRKMTSYESIQTDLKNAGANWVDQEVVSDQGIVTSRKPADIPAFNRKMIEEFAEGVHDRQRAVGGAR